ncbi:hypothetical protein LBC_16500 [Campylobacter sp. 19-13652]|nr:hypothetical protein LBC_16500 [Campylobacter sp. 19-13652]
MYKNSILSDYDGIKILASTNALSQEAAIVQVDDYATLDSKLRYGASRIHELFEFNVLSRLQRDKRTDLDANVWLNPAGIAYSLNAYAPLYDAISGRVLIADTAITNRLGLYYGAFKGGVNYYYNDLGVAKFDAPTHGDIVSNVIIGDIGTNLPKEYSQYDLKLDFMRDNGWVAFLGMHGTYDNRRIDDDFIRSELFYNIVNNNKIGVLSFSYGYYMTIDELRKGYRSDSNAKALAKYLRENDLFVAISLGNGTYDFNQGKRNQVPLIAHYEQDKYPELNRQLIAVGAVEANASIARYSFKCGEFKDFCLVAYGDTYYHDKVENAYHVEQGTSMAAPYVAGAAALVRSVLPFLDAHGVQQALLTTAKDLGDKYTYGWGLIQPHLAIYGPAQFWGEDFVADLDHNLDKRAGRAGEIFKFANDISGNYGLIVVGSGENNALSLSGLNTYKGSTRVGQGGVLNIDGIQTSSDTIIANDGTLYGSGVLKDVYNKGVLNAYSIFSSAKFNPNANLNEERNNRSMLIAGNFTQEANAKLNVLLGEPLAVAGSASLAGTLNIAGIKHAYALKNGSGFSLAENALIAKGGITGGFSATTQSMNAAFSNLKSEKISFSVSGQNYDAIKVSMDYAGDKAMLSNLGLAHDAAASAGATTLRRAIRSVASDENGDGLNLTPASSGLARVAANDTATPASAGSVVLSSASSPSTTALPSTASATLTPASSGFGLLASALPLMSDSELRDLLLSLGGERQAKSYQRASRARAYFGALDDASAIKPFLSELKASTQWLSSGSVRSLQASLASENVGLRASVREGKIDEARVRGLGLGVGFGQTFRAAVLGDYTDYFDKTLGMHTHSFSLRAVGGASFEAFGASVTPFASVGFGLDRVRSNRSQSVSNGVWLDTLAQKKHRRELGVGVSVGLGGLEAGYAVYRHFGDSPSELKGRLSDGVNEVAATLKTTPKSNLGQQLWLGYSKSWGSVAASVRAISDLKGENGARVELAYRF